MRQFIMGHDWDLKERIAGEALVEAQAGRLFVYQERKCGWARDKFSEVEVRAIILWAGGSFNEPLPPVIKTTAYGPTHPALRSFLTFYAARKRKTHWNGKKKRMAGKSLRYRVIING